MKHTPGWIFTAFIIALLLSASSYAQTGESLYFVAAKESRVQAQAWIDFLKRYELPVEHYVPSEIDLVKDHDFIAIAGGLDETGISDLLKNILGDAEVSSLETAETGKMILKENIWKPEQKVLVFAGKDAATAADARSDSKEEWMEYLEEWFDLEEVPGGLRAY